MLILKLLGIFLALVFFFTSRKYFFRWIGFEEPNEGFQVFFELPSLFFGMIFIRAIIANSGFIEIVGAIILFIVLQDFFEKEISFQSPREISIRQLYPMPAIITGIMVGLL